MKPLPSLGVAVGVDFLEARGVEFLEARGVEFLEAQGVEFLEARGVEFLEAQGVEFLGLAGQRQSLPAQEGVAIGMKFLGLAEVVQLATELVSMLT